jgi:hypothetical protein
MLVTFRIVDFDTRLHSKPANLNARELATFRAIMRDNNIISDLDEGEADGTAYNFEVSANSLPLAAFARPFEYRDDIIAIVEEAQFLGRSLRVQKDGLNVTLRVSQHLALANDLMMTDTVAEKALQALGIDGRAKRTVSLAKLKELVCDPAIFAAFDNAKIGNIYDALARLATTDCGEQLPRLVWT